MPKSNAQIEVTIETERVQGDLPSQVVPGSGSFLWSIPLSKADYTHGELVIYTGTTGGTHPRLRGFFKFGRADADGQGDVNVISVNLISLCVYYDRWTVGYAFRRDSKLSGPIFGSANLLQLSSIKINGSALELLFTNTTVTPSTLSAYLTADLWKSA